MPKGKNYYLENGVFLFVLFCVDKLWKFGQIWDEYASTLLKKRTSFPASEIRAWQIFHNKRFLWPTSFQ